MWSILNRPGSEIRPSFYRQRGNNKGGVMADPAFNKHKEYSRYAAHCLGLTPAVTDQEDRVINREMAAEWLKLADDMIALSTPVRIK